MQGEILQPLVLCRISTAPSYKAVAIHSAYFLSHVIYISNPAGSLQTATQRHSLTLTRLHYSTHPSDLRNQKIISRKVAMVVFTSPHRGHNTRCMSTPSPAYRHQEKRPISKSTIASPHAKLPFPTPISWTLMVITRLGRVTRVSRLELLFVG